MTKTTARKPDPRRQKAGLTSKARYILAIDQGTTGTTVSLVDLRGLIVAKINKEFQQIFPQPGWVEHDADDIWKSVVSTIDLCLKKIHAHPEEVAAIGITNQRETVVAWDRRTSKPLHHAIVWQDRRTSEMCDRMKTDGDLVEMIRDKTGLVVDPYFSASKIAWLLENVRGLQHKIDDGSLAVGTIDSFLLWRLTGGESFATDVSNASRTQLLNIETAQWDEDLLKYFKIPASILGEVKDSSGTFGVTKGLKVLPDGIPITGIAGDQQAALFGQTCFDIGESKCTFGTGSFLLINSGSEKVLSEVGLLTTIAWRLPGDAQPTYALEGGAFVCGAAVQFLRDQLDFFKHSREVEKLASEVKDSAGVEFVPALTGLGAPHWNPHARGLITGLTRGSTRAHIARATLEAMALQNAEILFAMQKNLGHSLRSMRVDGGASANDLLMQIQSDYLGVEVVRPDAIETTSLGAAYLAGLGAGVYKSLAEIKKIWKVDKTFKPKIKDDQRAVRLKSWQTAVSRAKWQPDI